MRYTLFFLYCLLLACLWPINCSLLPKTQRFVPDEYDNCYSINIYYSI
ncbi:hypothetical protein [Moorena sp. SIO4G3]|nr:hypothetical protein [Moorena sp. SIO4G3]NEO80464.1 hypothetical protein [Moorena sp. SIO4G3]